MRHITVMRIGEHRVFRCPANQCIEHKILSAALIGIPYSLNKETLVHQIDAHGHLHAMIGHGFFRDVTDKAVLRCIEDNVIPCVLIIRRMRHERNIRARILMKPQDLVEVDVIDKAAICEENITCRDMLDKVEIVVEIFEISLAPHGILLRRRQIKKPIMTTRQIPILARTKVIEHRARLIGEHDANLVDAGVDHARECKVNKTIAAGERNGLNSTTVGKLTNEAPVLLQINETHYGMHYIHSILFSVFSRHAVQWIRLLLSLLRGSL